MNLECLFAYSYLWAWGFCSMQEYNVHLDRLFSETPNNRVLLELEECSNNYKETFARLKRYFEYETNTFDSYIFGKTLFNGLEIVANCKCKLDTRMNKNSSAQAGLDCHTASTAGAVKDAAGKA